MPETDIGQPAPRDLLGDGATEPGMLSIEEKPEETTPVTSAVSTSMEARPLPSIPARALDRAGTVEHLAARRPMSALQVDTPDMKQQLGELRSDITRLVTGLRWGGVSVDETAERLVPLLNRGPIQQWKDTLLPFLREIDRAGNLVPVWLHIIELEEPEKLLPGANPAETPVGRARRYAVLMLGYYTAIPHAPLKDEKEPEAERPVELRLEIQFANSTREIQLNNQAPQEEKQKSSEASKEEPAELAMPDLPPLLGKLALDANLSLYATDALIRHATTPSIMALVSALKDAEGWAKVDIVESCLSLRQPRFYDLLVASGLERVAGLESYIAIPIYQAIPLENYIRGGKGIVPRLTEQSTLIFNQVLQEAINKPLPAAEELPPLFARNLPAMMDALFVQARREPSWQNAVTLHHLAVLLGRYWNAISHGQIQNERIVTPIGACLPSMPEIERWLVGPGRDMLLSTLTVNAMPEVPLAVIKALGDIRDPRAVSPLISYLDSITSLSDRALAQKVAAICETLGQLGDTRALVTMMALIKRVVNVEERASQPRRQENLPVGDPAIPVSMVYGAAVRACAAFADSSALEQTLQATHDFDPFTRTQAIESLGLIDPLGNDPRSRLAVRAALDDPRESVVRAASRVIIQYRDVESFPAFQRIIDTRPELSPVAYDALRRLAQ